LDPCGQVTAAAATSDWYTHQHDCHAKEEYVNPDPALVNQVNELLISIIGHEAREHCQLLADNGFTCDEINQMLARRVPEMERWRADTLAQFCRFYQEPDAPSLELQ
jgi:hypothetical protein